MKRSFVSRSDSARRELSADPRPVRSPQRRSFRRLRPWLFVLVVASLVGPSALMAVPITDNQTSGISGAFGCSFGSTGCQTGTATIAWDGTQPGITGSLAVNSGVFSLNASLQSPLWLVASPADMGRSAIVFVATSYSALNLAATIVRQNGNFTDWTIDPGQTGAVFWTRQDFDPLGQPIGSPVNEVAGNVPVRGSCRTRSLNPESSLPACTLKFGPWVSGDWAFSHQVRIPEPALGALLVATLLLARMGWRRVP